MKYLAFFSTILLVPWLPGCHEKSDGTASETGSSVTSDTAATTGTTGDGTPTTGDGTPTTGDGSSTTGDGTTTTGTTTDGGDSEASSVGETGATTAPLDEDCAFLIGKKFVSKKQWPCGPPRDPNDPGPLCPDLVSFDVDTFMFMSSDFGFGGTYTCDGGVISGVANDETYAGTIDAATAALVWEGEAFDVAP